MSATVLGISAFYHDSAAALVRDGRIIAAAQEERFSRVRHDPRFPRNAINYCLEEGFIEPSDLDAIVFYDSPLLSLDRIVRTSLQFGISGLHRFKQAVASILSNKMFVDDHVQVALGTAGRAGRVLYTEHHFAHAASAFYPSPFSESAIITLDGVGEWTTTAIGFGESERISLLEELHFPHSLGLLYSAFTSFCGFKVNSGEYKLMGLAAYGEPRYSTLIREHLIDIRPDGSYQLNLDYFSFLISDVMFNERFQALFGGEPRIPEGRITRREADLAASIQQVTTEIVLAIARHARAITGSRNVALAGGVALNCVAMGELANSSIFEHIWIQPAAGDAGGALGAAQLISHMKFGVPRAANSNGRDNQEGSFLGPRFSSREISAFLDRHSCRYDRISDPEQRAELIAEALNTGKVVGFFSGRMEFGPRALGARSILADPRNIEMQRTLNLKTKRRESFRPFAPAILAEDAAEYFDLVCESPYMLFATGLKESRRLRMEEARQYARDLLQSLHHARSEIPAVTHVDYSARVQTVTELQNPELYRVLTAFKRRTGIGALVNTSFNVRGEPIVCSPKDAYYCFMHTDIDLLVLEDVLLWKEKQPSPSTAAIPKALTNETIFDGPLGTALENFYESTALCAANRVRTRGRNLLIDGVSFPASYWRARRTESMLSHLGAESPHELEAYLKAWWERNELFELCDLAPSLADFASGFRNSKSQEAQLPTFLYAMF